MIPRQGDINNVKTDKIVGRFPCGLDIIYTDSLKHEDGAQRRLFLAERGTGRAAAVCLCWMPGD